MDKEIQNVSLDWEFNRVVKFSAERLKGITQ